MSIYFESSAETFDAAIYGTSKGYIRLGVLWEDLCQAVPDLETGKLSVLDVGGGMGQISLRLAHLGHHVVLVDPSEEMLDRVRESVQRENLNERVTVVHSTAQDLSQHIKDTFDLVLCHAVLEWVASPGELIRALSTFVNPNGRLSLMFYNHHAAVFRSVLRGDFERFATAEAAQRVEQSPPKSGGADTISGARGLSAQTVTHLLNECGFEVASRAGVRIFHDHVPDHLKREQLPTLLQLEKNYRHIEPFASLAQHIHLVCRRNFSNSSVTQLEPQEKDLTLIK